MYVCTYVFITKTAGTEGHWGKTVNACEIIIYVNDRNHTGMCKDFVQAMKPYTWRNVKAALILNFST